MHPMKIPKKIAIPIQTLVDVLCCTDELSENVMDLVFAVVIPWDFDELYERKNQETNVYIMQVELLFWE